MTPDKRSPRPVERQTGTEPLTLEENNSSDFNRTSESAFGAPTARCPDCNTRAVGGQFLHERSCPLDAAVRSAIASDRAWFRANPREATRRRPVADAEAAEVVAGTGWRPTDDVLVMRMGAMQTRGFTTGDHVKVVTVDVR